MSGSEIFEIIDDTTGEVIGTALRSQCHGNPSLLHRSVHVIVFHSDGRILLQKRKWTKDIQPGKWDTAVGGHLDPGETFEVAARREMREELGISSGELEYLFQLKVRNRIESENVCVFKTVCNGPFYPQESEVETVAFFELTDLQKKLENSDTAEFTPLLCEELAKLFAVMREQTNGILTEA